MSRRWVVVDLGSAREMVRGWHSGDVLTLADGLDLEGAGIYLHRCGRPVVIGPTEHLRAGSAEARLLRSAARAIERGELVRAPGSPEAWGLVAYAQGSTGRPRL
jgi:hypothetical protein